MGFRGNCVRLAVFLVYGLNTKFDKGFFFENFNDINEKRKFESFQLMKLFSKY